MDFTFLIFKKKQDMKLLENWILDSHNGHMKHKSQGCILVTQTSSMIPQNNTPGSIILDLIGGFLVSLPT